MEERIIVKLLKTSINTYVVCVCVCVWVCVCVCMCLCLCVCVWGGGGAFAFVYVPALVYDPWCMCDCLYMRSNACAHVFVCVFMCAVGRSGSQWVIARFVMPIHFTAYHLVAFRFVYATYQTNGR